MTTQAAHQRALLFALVAVLVVALIAGGAPLAAQQTPTSDQPSPVASGSDFRSSPVMFIENAGQWPDAARFQVWGGPAETMWLTEDAIWLTVVERPANDVGRLQMDPLARFDPERSNLQPSNIQRKATNIKLSFVDANPHPRIEPFDRLNTVVSYFLGNDPDQWRPDVPVWGGVRYVDLYPGVDLEVTSEGGQTVQRLATRPGGDLGKVQLRVEGADAVAADGDALHLSTAASDTVFPLVRVEGLNFERLNAQTLEMTAPLTPARTNQQSAIGNPQSSLDNPADLLYGTFLGGSGGDSGRSIAVDGAGNAYVTSTTYSSNFPTTPGTFDPIFYGGSDAFVVKLDSTGSGLAYATFVGGSSYDYGASIAVDDAGRAYVTGSTDSSDFPATPGASDRSLGGYSDSFVIKLNQTGSGLTYATFLGGSGEDYGDSIAVDGAGSAHVMGGTRSSDFPVMPGSFDRSFNGLYDAFVAKLDPDGSGLTYATFLGGNGADEAYGITVDGAGSVYVTAWTSSSDFPTTPGALDRSYNGGDDAFVLKLKPDGSGLSYSTFLGGSSADYGYAITIDAAGCAYVTGSTGSSDFPVTARAFDPSYNGLYGDAFVAKLDPNGSGLAYATFLGGSNWDGGSAIVVDGAGSAYVAGSTSSSDFPTTLGALDQSHNGDDDAFVLKLKPDGSGMSYSTFLGGYGDDRGEAIAMDAAGSLSVTGWTGSSDFSTTPGAFDRSYNEGIDAFVVKLAMGITPTYTISGRVTDANGTTGIAGVTVWAGFPRNTTTDADGNYTFTGLPAGTYNIRPDKDPYAFSPASVSVTVPPDKTGVDFQAVAITKIQVNQALGNTTNYVAGKDTAVRVFMSDVVPFGPDYQQLQIYRDGSLITPTPLKPQRFSGRSNVLDFLCDRAECDGWQKGFYSFEARVNGDYLIQPSVEFQESGALRVLVVPVKTQAGSPQFNWLDLRTFIDKVYPIAPDSLTWRIGNELTADDLDLTNDSTGKFTLEQRLAARRRIPRGRSYDEVVGVIPYDPSVGKGWTRTSRVAVVAVVPEIQTVAAHEIGHDIGFVAGDNFTGLGDEYNPGGYYQCKINPAPPTYVGKDGRDGPGGKSCTDLTIDPWDPSPLAPNATGSTVRGVGGDQDYPFEVGGRGDLGDMLSFMGHGEWQARFWVTPKVYNHLFANLSSIAARTATVPETTERVIDVSGWIHSDDTVTLSPAYHFEAVSPPVVAGAYSVEVVDAQGIILATQGFDVSFAILADPPQDADEGPFWTTVRLPAGSTQLRVKHGGTVLTGIIISAHAPTLSLTYPSGGQTWGATGNYTIRWQGDDVDGDTLHYTILYRQGTGDWSVLGTDLTANELTVNAADLPGGTAAEVQVLATDGINTTAVESAPFTVGRKPPEAFITYPADDAGFMPGVSLFLQGTAYDLEDGALPDSAYRWTSNKDGDLSSGASNLVILSPGPHVIMLTVTDSDGNTAVKTIRLSTGNQVFLPTIVRGQ
jgi:hypothetical protein